MLFDNFLIVGISNGNGATREEHRETKPLHLNQGWSPKGSKGIITPRTVGWRANDIKFYNFYEGMTIVDSCSECFHMKKWNNGGAEATFENIYLDSSTTSAANMIFWQKWGREVIYDKGGSLVGENSDRWITKNHPHFQDLIDQGVCTLPDQDKYDGAIICKVQLRAVKFSNFEKKVTFEGITMKTLDITHNNFTRSDVDNGTTPLAEKFGETQMKLIKNSNSAGKGQHIAVVAAGYVWNFHWMFGIDFSHLMIGTTPFHKLDDPTIVVRFNYSQTREMFDIFRMQSNSILKDNPLYDPNSDVHPKRIADSFQHQDLSSLVHANNTANNACQFGDWHHNSDDQLLYVCINGKNRVWFDKVDVNAVFCRETCPVPGALCTSDGKDRSWSDLANWKAEPSVRVPHPDSTSEADNPYVPYDDATHGGG